MINTPIDSTTKFQLELFSTIVSTLEKNNLSYWVLGGFAVDGLLGKVTRPHHDIDFFIEFSSRDKVAELVTTKAVYNFLVITGWYDYKFVVYDPRKEIHADFGFITLEHGKATFLHADQTFILPDLLFPKDKVVSLEGLRFKVIDPALIYVSKLCPPWIHNSDQHEIDKKEAQLIEHLVDKKLAQEITPTISGLANFFREKG